MRESSFSRFRNPRAFLTRRFTQINADDDALVGKSGFRRVLTPTDWVVAAEEVAAEGLGDDLAAPVEVAV